MRHMRVAVVPYDRELETPDVAGQIMRVASALRNQVTEHFAPAWDVSASVVGYSSLDKVPPGYSTLALTRQQLPRGRAGFHYPGSPPGALIEISGPYDPTDWSVAASHELLEMLADPSGTTAVVGPSLADRKLEAGAPPDKIVKDEATYAEQGLVEYLKELCDPVQCSSYEIDGVGVSDFVLPSFYKPYATGVQYSFRGTVERPFGVLAGGYISWTTRSDSTVYQAFGQGADCGPVSDRDLKIEKVGPAPALLSRQWLDSNPAAKSLLVQSPLSFSDASTESYGDRLRTEIGLRLRSFAPPSSDVGPYLEVIRKLAWDTTFYKQCEADTTVLEGALRALGSDVVDLSGETIASQQTYRALLRGYEQGHRFGYDFSTDRDAVLLAQMYHWPPGGQPPRG